jgi:hypothetical protein
MIREINPRQNKKETTSTPHHPHTPHDHPTTHTQRGEKKRDDPEIWISFFAFS